MSIKNFFKSLFKKSYGVSTFNTQTSASDRTISNSNVLRFYKNEEVFSSSIDSIAKACYISGFRIKPMNESDKVEPERIRLVKTYLKWHVNEKDTFNDLLLSIFMDLLTFNNAYLEKKKINKGWLSFKENIKNKKYKNIKEFPFKLYYIPADSIKPILDKGNRRVIKYRQTAGELLEFSADECYTEIAF